MKRRHELIKFCCCLITLAASLAVSPQPAAAQSVTDMSETETDGSGDLSISFAVDVVWGGGEEDYDLGSGWIPGTTITEYNDCNCNDIPSYPVYGSYEMSSWYEGEDESEIEIEYDTYAQEVSSSQCLYCTGSCSSPTQLESYYEYYDTYYFEVFDES